MRKLIIAAAIITASASAQAQDTDYSCQKGSYITFDIGGGLQNISYKLGEAGDKDAGFGMTARLAFRHYFSKHFGMGLGIELQKYKAKSTLNFVESIDNAIDEDGDRYELRSYLSNVEEKQELGIISLPIGFYYQCNLSERLKLNLGLGMEFGLADKSDYSVSHGEIKTTGYLAADMVEFEDMPWHQFKTNDAKFDGDFATRAKIAPYLEAGIMYALGQRLDLTATMLGSYSVASTSKDNSGKPLCDIDVYNGLLNSGIVEKSHTPQLGLQVGLRYRLGKPKKGVTENDLDKETKHANIEQDNVVADDSHNGSPQDGRQNVDNEDIEAVAVNDISGGVSMDDIRKAEEEAKAREAKKIAQEQLKESVSNIEPFEFPAVGSTSPDNKQSSALDALAEALKKNPESEVWIYGHTCNLGSLETNKRVGQERANWMKQELMKRGISESRLHADSKWYSEPLVPNTTEQNRKKNRRVEIVVK